MKTSQSAWQTPELSKSFLEGVRGAIPGADLQLAVIEKIIQLQSPSPKSILDLGCGNGILGRFLLTRFPSAQGQFVDFSEPMLAAARQNLRSLPQARVVQTDFSTPQWRETVGNSPLFNIVISGFAIHHQPDARKRALYTEIYDLLAGDGVFLNLEHVASATSSGEDLFDAFFIDHLYEFHSRSNPSSNREEIARRYYERPDKDENILAPVAVQCQWLREIGFRDVDCFFKVFELALFGGRKD